MRSCIGAPVNCAARCPVEWTVGKRFSAFSKLRDEILVKEGVIKAAEADSRARRSSVGAPTPSLKRREHAKSREAGTEEVA